MWLYLNLLNGKAPNQNKMDVHDRLLLKLKRQYSKDETVALLTKKLKEAELENGILKSELSELNDLLIEKNTILLEKNNLIKRWHSNLKRKNDEAKKQNPNLIPFHKRNKTVIHDNEL